MSIKYVFKEKPLLIQNAKIANAQRVGEALTEIKNRTKGAKFNSGTVLNAARDRKNYLHQFFEWNNTVAADKYRKDQARELIACIDIIDTADKKRAPAFISLITRTGREYHTVKEVLSSSSLAALMLKQLEAEMENMEVRLMQYAEIAQAVRHARELIAERRKRYETSFPGFA